MDPDGFTLVLRRATRARPAGVAVRPAPSRELAEWAARCDKHWRETRVFAQIAPHASQVGAIVCLGLGHVDAMRVPALQASLARTVAQLAPPGTRVLAFDPVWDEGARKAVAEWAEVAESLEAALAAAGDAPALVAMPHCDAIVHEPVLRWAAARRERTVLVGNAPELWLRVAAARPAEADKSPLTRALAEALARQERWIGRCVAAAPLDLADAREDAGTIDGETLFLALQGTAVIEVGAASSDENG